jgi:hypothetical protein
MEIVPHRLSLTGTSPDALVASLSRFPAQEHRSGFIGHIIKHELGKWAVVGENGY